MKTAMVNPAYFASSARVWCVCVCACVCVRACSHWNSTLKRRAGEDVGPFVPGSGGDDFEDEESRGGEWRVDVVLIVPRSCGDDYTYEDEDEESRGGE